MPDLESSEYWISEASNSMEDKSSVNHLSRPTFTECLLPNHCEQALPSRGFRGKHGRRYACRMPSQNRRDINHTAVSQNRTVSAWTDEQSKETSNRDEKEKVLAEKLYQRRNDQTGPSAVKISNEQVAEAMHTKMWSVCHGGASVGMNWMAGMIHKNSKRMKTMFNCPISQKVKKKKSSVNTDVEAFLSSENYSYQPHEDWDCWGWTGWLGDQHVFKFSNGRPHKIPPFRFNISPLP